MDDSPPPLNPAPGPGPGPGPGLDVDVDVDAVPTPVRTRLFVDEPLAAGAAIGLDRARAHYLLRVLRLGRGDAVGLFNGRDGEWTARVDGVGRAWCSVAVVARRRPQQPSPDLWLLFAPIKRARIDFLIEKATELGCRRLQPVITRRTMVARVKGDRLLANAIEAAEQTERLDIPDVRAPQSLEAALRCWSTDRRLLAAVEAGDAIPAAAAVRRLVATGAGGTLPPLAVLTGPEGGFAPEERQMLRAQPFVTPIGLGPRLLRADTAALAALAVVQAVAGDGDQRPPDRDGSGAPAGWAWPDSGQADAADDEPDPS